MNPKPDPKDYWRDLCANLHDEDGLTPADRRKDKSRESRDRSDRVTLRLCSQAGRAIRLSLLADCHDMDLQSLDVIEVEPWPDARRLRVHLVCALAETAPEQVIIKIHSVEHLLRYAVAQAVTRKRAPQLLFVVHPSHAQGGTEHDK